MPAAWRTCFATCSTTRACRRSRSCSRSISSRIPEERFCSTEERAATRHRCMVRGYPRRCVKRLGARDALLERLGLPTVSAIPPRPIMVPALAWLARARRLDPERRAIAGWLITPTPPPSASAIRFTVARPIPSPGWPAGRRAPERLERGVSAPGPEPAPLSSTSMRTRLPAQRAAIATRRSVALPVDHVLDRVADEVRRRARPARGRAHDLDVRAERRPAWSVAFSATRRRSLTMPSNHVADIGRSAGLDLRHRRRRSQQTVDDAGPCADPAPRAS